MTDKQKLEKILSLLTDSNVQKMRELGQLENDDEVTGAIIFATNTFDKVYKIVKRNK